MKIFGVNFGRKEKAIGGGMLSAPSRGGWMTIFDWKPGAWQADAAFTDSTEQLTAFSAVFACVTRIALDIAKLRIKLMRLESERIWREVVAQSPFLGVLRKPNHFQTRIQFLAQWIISNLLHGNAYILKERDARGIVVALYVLDACRVTPLVAPDGGVYYQLSDDYLSGVSQQITVPASEIIHDRPITLWHPLIGVSPIYACARSAMQGLRIQSNSSKFFENMSRPSGMLTAPGSIDDVTAERLRTEFEKKFGGGNLGRLLVGGDGLKYEPMTIPAADAQLIEQLKWTAEDVARCFHVPPWMIGIGAMPAYGNSEIAQRGYYSGTLQHPIESIELLLDEGLSLPADLGTEFDVDGGLLRMDKKARYETHAIGIGAGMTKPDDARAEEGLPPVDGGDQCYLQQQNYSLAALAKRDAQDDPFGGKTPAPQLPPPDDSQKASEFHLKALEAFDLELRAA